MVKKFSATLDVEFIIDFEVWGIPKEEQHKFLLDCIRYLGHDRVEESFYYEQEREKEGVSGSYYHVDDPIGYFTKRLPEMLKEDKASKNK